MAELGLPPKEIPPDIYFKCHPRQVNSTVFCVLCENVFHKSDFNRKKGIKYVSSVSVVCDEHTDLDLTSISCQDPRVILCQLKATCKKYKEEAEKFNRNYLILQKDHKKLQQKYEGLLAEIEKNSNVDDDNAMDQGNTDTNVALIQSYKEQNSLLKDINEELKDKNALLKEMIEKEKERQITVRKSYADATAAKQPIELPKIIPKIVVIKMTRLI
ncbi:uncharacterized protein LOC116416696 [Nasonia vitripennis]|uniref:Uncharacterized protein n=1 Tax=Nasonia vitripennis TaxID=7425 RepID=A0A7M7Q8W7_NASVI|nr:uncharacterized protein LOC116416696 [Nasonia vitripennis]